jgi:hypothetical protein
MHTTPLNPSSDDGESESRLFSVLGQHWGPIRLKPSPKALSQRRLSAIGQSSNGSGANTRVSWMVSI